MQKTIFAAHCDASDCDDQQRHVLTNLERRAAAGQIDRRGFLELAAAIGIGSAFAAAMADRAMASPQVQGQGGRNIEASYDYIVGGRFCRLRDRGPSFRRSCLPRLAD
jgi:hypothetical protein